MLVKVGIALMIAAVLAGVCAFFFLHGAKVKLEKQFEIEYGKKRHT